MLYYFSLTSGIRVKDWRSQGAMDLEAERIHFYEVHRVDGSKIWESQGFLDMRTCSRQSEERKGSV